MDPQEDGDPGVGADVVVIREYQDSDYREVRGLLASGMGEYAPALCAHVLRQPWVLLVLSCTFCLLLASARSLLLPVLALTLLLAAGRQALTWAWGLYIARCLGEDLLDVRAAYAEEAGGRFWVAEAGGRVVGTVGARPARGEARELVLKRLTVRRGWRGRGIAKRLCRVVLDFARLRGSRAVVLHTVVVQRDARLLYAGLGFRPGPPQLLPTVYGRLANFTVTHFRYDLGPEPTD
ncbi:probable N-acetyltransferase camello [Ornithorhynchus anatinus]|uniref:probable N-acetyltransferase camello n=1 Tax=Ornithorhynchus anatinus TaxID=9258 RepID=UPI0001554F03|nr:probable N-acetyltransferase camello [Ornithorhynchus anatinus]